jgi:hypothetical protein
MTNNIESSFGKYIEKNINAVSRIQGGFRARKAKERVE